VGPQRHLRERSLPAQQAVPGAPARHHRAPRRVDRRQRHGPRRRGGGPRAMVGAGAVVTHDVPPYAIVTGNPARITGYVRRAAQAGGSAPAGRGPAAGPRRVGAAPRRHARLRGHARHALRGRDARGRCRSCPSATSSSTTWPSKDVRGEHAHRKLEQFIVLPARLLRGGARRRDGARRGGAGCAVGGHLRAAHDLDVALPATPRTRSCWCWRANAYDAADYVRDYDEFVRLRRA
jgi:hypothetical protein